MKKVLLSLILIIPMLGGCLDLPNDVTIPQWDTELNLPLTQREYTLDELIKTDQYISIDSANGNIYVAKHSSMAEQLSIEDFIEGKLDQTGEAELVVASGSGSAFILYQNGMALDSAYFERGTLKITITNSGNSSMDLSLSLPAFVKGGSPLTISGQVSSGEKKNFLNHLLVINMIT